MGLCQAHVTHFKASCLMTNLRQNRDNNVNNELSVKVRIIDNSVLLTLLKIRNLAKEINSEYKIKRLNSENSLLPK